MKATFGGVPHTSFRYHCHPCSSSQVSTSVCMYRYIHRLCIHVPKSGDKYPVSGHTPVCHSLHVAWLEQKNCWLAQKLWLQWSYAGSELTFFICPLPGCNLSSERMLFQAERSKPGCFWKHEHAPCFSSLHTHFLHSSQLLWCIFTFPGEDATVRTRLHLFLTCP